MSRFGLALISLLVFFIAAHGLAQAADDIKFELSQSLNPSSPLASAELPPQGPGFRDQPSRLPSVEPSTVLPPRQTGTAGEASLSGELPPGKDINLDGSPIEKPVAALNDFIGYRYSTSALEWIPGNGDEFGIFSVELDHYLRAGFQSGIVTGFGFHVFSGPVKSDMPPRAYDFSIGYQIRHQIGPLAFDLASAVQAASDFNGNARKGIQYPGHGVGYLSVSPEVELVFGVDYLDRADIKLLPVAGVVWKRSPDMRLELVFPRPRAIFQLTDTYRLYFSGELGGGTWAIERPVLGDNVATYRDIRACIGLASVEKDGRQSAIEVGYLFDRRLEYTSGAGNMHLGDAVMVRLVTMY